MIVLAAVIPVVGLVLLLLLGAFEDRFFASDLSGGPPGEPAGRAAAKAPPPTLRLRLESTPELDARMLARATPRVDAPKPRPAIG